MADNGLTYYWTWLPLKIGYGKWIEGIALLTLSPMTGAKIILVSVEDDFNNWKTRKILGIQTENMPDTWFYSVHFGWWEDSDDPFSNQWDRAVKALPPNDTVWLMGDFNNPADIRGEGYDLISDSGWHDAYDLAKIKDNGMTVSKKIDGWNESSIAAKGMRIDQIWCNKPRNILSSQVVFNGISGDIVSDHYGVMIEYERS